MTDARAQLLAARFDEHRSHARRVAYRMLGSHAESDDVVQDAWLRLSRMDDEQTSGIDNLGGWITTVVSRLCLDRLRGRSRHRVGSLDSHVPDPTVSAFETSGPAGGDPATTAELADTVSLALLVVLEALPPAERLAFVLHDTFAVPFDEIAPIVGRSEDATRQLASRARRRLRDTPADLESRAARDTARQREVVEAWSAAARGGDFEALLGLLDPDVVLRVDAGPGLSTVRRGAATVARGAASYRHPAAVPVVVGVNGTPGLLVRVDGVPASLAHFTFGPDGKIVAVSIIADRDRLATLDLPA
jgi:RNA polymerase sigma-70 factor (ECF subfamily)